MQCQGATESAGEFRAAYRVVVVGAGLVGLLLAIVLRRVGYSVLVLDKDTELSEIGAGIILPANACRALDQANVLEKVKASAIAPREWISHSYRTGAALGRMELDQFIQERYKVPFLVIHRSDLRRILYEEAIIQGADIKLGTKADIRNANFEKGIIHANMTDTAGIPACTLGESERKFDIAADLVVAADGQQSEGRELLAGKANEPVPTGKMVNRVLMGIERMREIGLEDLIDPPCIHVWLGPNSLAVGYLLKDVFNFVLTCSSENEESVFLGFKEVKKEELCAVFQQWDPRIRSLVEHGHGYRKWLLLDNSRSRPNSWVHAKEGEKLLLALTGDAAHAIGPYIGSGAALGFESATVLGELLGRATCAADIPALLNLYESLRRPRTDLVGAVTQKMAREWMLPDGPLQAKRDQIFLEETPPLQGYPNALQDPFFQIWLYSFDGREEANNIWRAKCQAGWM